MNKQVKLLTCLLLGLGAGQIAWAKNQPSKINPGLAQFAANDRVDVIIHLADKAEVLQIKENNRSRKRARMLHLLKNKANKSQGRLISWLHKNGAKQIKSIWLNNTIAANIDADLLDQLSGDEQIAYISLDAKVKGPGKPDNNQQPPSTPPAAPGWNGSAIRINELWDMGHIGSGTVIASMDSGVDVQHPDLQAKWRGGVNSWYDPYNQHATPGDNTGHGTQSMGILLGGDAGGTTIGVAPGAQWIAAKIYNDSNQATYSAIHLAYQWMLDPDNNADSDDAPDVINNSWGLQNTVGYCDTEFQNDIAILRAADIAVVFSAGNYGPNPGTSVSPANNNGSLAVGAVDDTLTVAGFSSRGPSACGDGMGIYPQLAAPGVSVTTTDLTFGGLFPDAYISVTGTSFAAPHVAGAIAVLRSAEPTKTLDQIEQALKDGANTYAADNDYGWGVLDVSAAYSVLTAVIDNDNDGYAEAVDCNDHNAAINPGAAEIKFDGVDQDCNGYDLTIEVLMAEVDGKGLLTVEAGSALGANANLKVDGYGALKWNAASATWKATFRRAGAPASVIVSGVEGSETATVNQI